MRRPIPMTINADARPSHGNSFSGKMNCDANSVTRPMMNTLDVCMVVMVRPSPMAWRGVARVPTRYAAAIVLPWPGSNACSAPNATAVSKAMMMTDGLSSRRVMSSANSASVLAEPNALVGAVFAMAGFGRGEANVPLMRNLALSCRTGADSIFCGYWRNSLLTSWSETVESRMFTPFCPRATISRQPNRSGSLLS